MELRQLKYFITVAQTLSFSEASRRLYITQGTLSQQIQQLEGEIGARLFDRNRHAVFLTDTLKQFIKAHPGVKVKIQSETAAELIEMLRCKELDLALTFKPASAYDELESEPLFKNHLSAVMRKDHPLASSKVLTMEQLENHRIVLPGKGMQARRAFDRYLGLDTRKLNVVVEVNDPGLIMDIVQSTNLIAIVSSLASYYRPDLVAVPLEEGNYTMIGCIHRLKDGYRKRAADIFADMLRDSVQVERISKGLD